ncbi:hypothetical protein WDU94_005656 [Cyamophila willieti]
MPTFNWELGVSGNENSYIKSKSDLLYSLFSSLNLVQSNFQRILAEDNILDLVLSNFPDDLTVEKEPGLVDWDHRHPGLLVNFSVSTYCNTSTPLVKKKFCKGDYLGLYNYLYRYRFIDSNEVDELVTDLTSAVTNAIQSYIPDKVISPSKYPHWFSKNLIRLLHLKEKFHKKSKKSPNNSHFKANFLKFRKICKKVLHNDELAYKRKVESDLKNNPKFFWQYIKTQYKNSHEVNIVDENSHLIPTENVPDIFASHFSSIYNSSQIPSDGNNSSFPNNNLPLILEPPNISINDVVKAAKSLKCSQVAGIDNIPSFIVKGSIQILAPILCKIFNRCLELGKFPSLWKTSIVVPVPKNSSVQNVKNYRPISLLTNFSKIFEKIIMNHVTFHVKDQLSSNQHGFLSGRSTSTNLVSFLQFIAPAVLDRNQVDTIYFDLSRAFDVVNHALLVKKLGKFGLSHLYSKFFSDYLGGRHFKVKLGNFLSSDHSIPCGVPQGSNLGPLLFLIFFDDIKNVILSHFEIFADDLKISRVIHEHDDVLYLQNDINSILQWCSDNGMCVNSSKTVVVSYSRKLNTYYHNYVLGDSIITRKHVQRDLGVLFDNKLDFSHHIRLTLNKGKKCSSLVYWVTKNFRKTISITVLFNALVRSKLEYCSEVWGGFGITQSVDIEQIQKNFLRRISFRSNGISSSYNISLTRYQLTTLSARRTYKEICFIFKLINGLIACSKLLEKLNFNIPRLRTRHYLPFKTTNLQLVPLNRMMLSCNKYPNLDYSQPFSIFSQIIKDNLYNFQ